MATETAEEPPGQKSIPGSALRLEHHPEKEQVGAGQDTQAGHSWFSVLLSSLPDNQPHSLMNQSQLLRFVSRPPVLTLCESPSSVVCHGF